MTLSQILVWRCIPYLCTRKVETCSLWQYHISSSMYVSSAGEEFTLGYVLHPAHGKHCCKNCFQLLLFSHHSENCLAGIVNFMSLALFCFAKKDFQFPHCRNTAMENTRSEEQTCFPFWKTSASTPSGAAFLLSPACCAKRVILWVVCCNKGKQKRR